MKPKQAKAMTAPAELDPAITSSSEAYRANPINEAIERVWYSKNQHFWQALRIIIDGIEKAGYKVSITIDNQEFNK